MDALQEQLRHLATQPEFISQFLHEGAYVFPIEPPQLVESKAPIPEEITPQAAVVESVQVQSVSSTLEPVKAEPTIVAIPKVSATAGRVEEAPAAENSWLNKVVVLLPPEPSIKEVQFLHKILAASAVTDEQVYLQEKIYQARGLAVFAGSRLVLSFGAVSDFVADYQLRSKAITVIMADKLSVVETDLEAKKKLWAAMKSFFK